jgi:hypothetical protein
MVSITPETASRTVLLAETDPHTLNQLPRILSDRLPQVTIDASTSSDANEHLDNIRKFSVVCPLAGLYSKPPAIVGL